ncbi:MAG: Lactate utilization protein C [Desulfovibrio sp.]
MSHIELFKAKAAAVSTTVIEAATAREAADYALRLFSEKVFCRPTGDAGDGTLAAPDVPEDLFAHLAASGKNLGVTVLGDTLRARMQGVDVGFSVADLAIAETGTAVLRCSGEDARLASMICETHVVVLPKSKIVGTSYDAEDFLREAMQGVMYTAFISGCSRTSDIERVLTLGVHGPLELHVVLTEEA